MAKMLIHFSTAAGVGDSSRLAFLAQNMINELILINTKQQNTIG